MLHHEVLKIEVTENLQRQFLELLVANGFKSLKEARQEAQHLLELTEHLR